MNTVYPGRPQLIYKDEISSEILSMTVAAENLFDLDGSWRISMDARMSTRPQEEEDIRIILSPIPDDPAVRSTGVGNIQVVSESKKHPGEYSITVIGEAGFVKFVAQ